jgi:hypothetical protein
VQEEKGRDRRERGERERERERERDTVDAKEPPPLNLLITQRVVL